MTDSQPQPKLLAYLGHPISDSDAAQRQNNIANALAWCAFLVDVTRWAVAAPWLPYVQTLNDTTHRGRGYDDALVSLVRSDLYVVAGGPTPAAGNMNREIYIARENGIPIIDLASFGYDVPRAATEQVAAAIALRAHNAFVKAPRRVVSSISKEDLVALRACRAALHLEHALPEAAGVLGKIIAAAEVRP